MFATLTFRNRNKGSDIKQKRPYSFFRGLKFFITKRSKNSQGTVESIILRLNFVFYLIARKVKILEKLDNDIANINDFEECTISSESAQVIQLNQQTDLHQPHADKTRLYELYKQQTNEFSKSEIQQLF